MFFALLRKGINDEFATGPKSWSFSTARTVRARKDTDPGYKATRPEGAEALRPILALPEVKAGLDRSASPGSRSTTPKPTT